jgi:endo-1,4-beta-xylanase
LAAQKKTTDVTAGNLATVWVNQPKPGSLPAGMTHHTYSSKSMGHEVGYCIYLPPGYEKDTGRHYPVIYTLHGAGGNELHGQLSAQVLQEGILAKRLPPMILVMPNGGRYTYYKDSYDGKFMGETTIIRELIPHIDATYRTIAGAKGRCIEGFSMGGRGATRLAMKYPEMFCSLFNQSGNVFHIADMFDPAQPGKYPNNYLGPDRARYVDNDAFLLLQKNVDRIKAGLRIQMYCGTTDDEHLPSVREFHEALLKAGVEHGYKEIEGLDHNQSKMIQLNRATWFDHHVESLKHAGAFKD